MLHHRKGHISEQAFDMLQKMAFQHYVGDGKSDFHLYKRFAKATALPAIEELVSEGLCDITVDKSVEEFVKESYDKGIINGLFGKLICWMMSNPDRVCYYRINLAGFKYLVSRGQKLDMDFMYRYASDYVYVEEMKAKNKESAI